MHCPVLESDNTRQTLEVFTTSVWSHVDPMWRADQCPPRVASSSLGAGGEGQMSKRSEIDA